jgi:uncharacterized protein
VKRPLFEFDPGKSEINKKHGLDFCEAQEIWDDPYLRTWGPKQHLLLGGAHEARYFTVGAFKGVLHFAVITYNGPIVRLISVRPLNIANPTERKMRDAYVLHKQKAVAQKLLKSRKK